MSDISPNDETGAFAAKVLLKHLSALIGQVHRRDTGDVRRVHQIRVCGRRLRNAMKVFADALPEKSRKRWNKHIRRLSRAMGPVRDADVQIQAVESYLQRSIDPNRRGRDAGAERLLCRVRQRRKELSRKAEKAREKALKRGVLDEMRRDLAAMRTLYSPPHSPALRDRAVRDIAMRLEQVLAYEPFVHKPEQVEELHAMRIAFKRLRYTMEAYIALDREALRPHVRIVKQFQKLLGDLHDCDIWIAMLPQFIEQERRRHTEFHGHGRGFARIARGVERFRQDRIDHRAELYGAFVELWDRQTAHHRWGAIRTCMAAHPQPDTASDGDDDADHSIASRGQAAIPRDEQIPQTLPLRSADHGGVEGEAGASRG